VSAKLCPKCNAQLPPTGRFCLECGCDLYQAGVRRAPLFSARNLGIFAAAVGLLALVVVLSRGRFAGPDDAMPPEERQVRELTRQLLGLARSGKYAELVRRFYRPNADEFQAIDHTLQQIVRGRGAPGLNIFRANAMDDLGEARKFVDRFGARHPAYVVSVLAALTFQDGELRATLGGAPLGVQRAEDFCAWHFKMAFDGVDPGSATVADVRWRDAPDGSRLLVASVSFPSPLQAVPGLIDVRQLPWRLLPDGTWALAFGSRLNLDEVLDFLLRARL